MKIYLAGGMTGYVDFNYPAFNAMAAQLRAEGHEVVNPAEIQLDGDVSKDWHHYMKQDLKAMMDCDTIALLPGWEKSRGATLELFIATQLGMDVMHVPAPVATHSWGEVQWEGK